MRSIKVAEVTETEPSKIDETQVKDRDNFQKNDRKSSLWGQKNKEGNKQR